MNNQTIPADEVRDLAARFRQQMEPHTPAVECAVWERAAEAVESLLPRPTLADMTPEERDDCQWMQADLNSYGSRVVILNPGWDDGSARVMWMHTRTGVVPHRDITPRPDLPRMEWPGDQKAEDTPALPEGWRLADHKDNGRIVVTNTNPNSDGRVYYVLPADADHLEFDWLSCTPDRLTYIDQEAEDVTPVKVGDVIESADDPRLAALPVGSVLLDRDRETVAKRDKVWAGLGYIPIESEGDEFGPWTVRRIGWEDDQ